MKRPKTEAKFYGYWHHKCLIAVIEITVKNKQIGICSLAVTPKFFRKGIPNQLISYVLQTFDCKQAFVETAVENLPAINLYKKHGFIEKNIWKTSDGFHIQSLLKII